MSRLSREEAVEIVNRLDEYRIRFENASDDASENFSTLLNHLSIQELLNGIRIEFPESQPGTIAEQLARLTKKFFDQHRILLGTHRYDDGKTPALRDIEFDPVSREWKVEIPRSRLKIRESTKDTLSHKRRAELIRKAGEELLHK